MDMKAFFEQYEEISRLIERRFDQYKATFDTNIHMDGNLSSWEYDCGFIEIHWSAYWRYGGHDNGSIDMPLEWFEMSEEEWQKVLDEETRRREKNKLAEERAKKAAATRKRNEKEKREREQLKKLKEKYEND